MVDPGVGLGSEAGVDASGRYRRGSRFEGNYLEVKACSRTRVASPHRLPSESEFPLCFVHMSACPASVVFLFLKWRASRPSILHQSFINPSSPLRCLSVSVRTLPTLACFYIRFMFSLYKKKYCKMCRGNVFVCIHIRVEHKLLSQLSTDSVFQVFTRSIEVWIECERSFP